MKLTVANKLFLSVLSVALFVIALIVGLAGWSLRQGFSNYLTQTELNRQELLVKRLQEIYAARGNWDLFTDAETSWQKFVESILLQEQELPPIKAGQRSLNSQTIAQARLLSLASLTISAVDTPGFNLVQLAQNSNQRPLNERDDPGRRPPPNAFQDCRGKSEGDTVMHSTPDGLLRATCENSPEGLVARPNRSGQDMRRPPDLPSGLQPASPKSVPSNPTPPNQNQPNQTPRSSSTPSSVPPRSPLTPPSPRFIPKPSEAVLPPPPKEEVQKAPAAVEPLRVVNELERPLTVLAKRFILLDRTGEQIAGVRLNMSDKVLSRPLMHDGKLIGQLGIVVTASSSVIDQAFIDHSLQMLFIVAGVAFLLSVLASLWMAGHVKSILRQITLAARRLASGEYSIRVESARSDEFGDLVRDFNRLAHALEQHESNRRLWVAQTSHELRTPVSILRAHIEALLDGVRTPGRQEFEVLLKETMRLAKLINDLNDLARADSGALAFQKRPVDLTVLIHEMISSFSDRFEKQQIKISTQLTETAFVFGDASRLSQLFANVFENTLRYTDAGGQISILIHIKDHSVVLVLEDSAPGVESTVLASLFDPFFRTEQSRHRESGGSGLGLAICKSIVSAHEGTIQAEHSKLGGLKLTITLPCLESNP